MTEVGVYVESKFWCVRVGREEALYGVEADIVDGFRAQAVAFDVAYPLYHLLVHRGEFV